MAVIVSGKKPDTCLSEVSSELHCPIVESCTAFHDAYHHRFEPLGNAHKCRLEDCSIIGEIPDNHGRIVDLDKVLEWFIKEKRVFSKQGSPSDMLAKAFSGAPVILEATNEKK